MLLPPPNPSIKRDSYGEAYQSIIAKHRRSPMTSASSVVILVAPDVDALCASRMFAELLKQDDVLHRIIPVSGLADLERMKNELLTYTELHTLILLNMGSILDLPSNDWFGCFEENLTLHVIDSNRPQNLSSLFGSEDPEVDKRILIWDDGDAEKLTEEKKAWESILYDPEPDSESDDSDDDLLISDDEGDDEEEEEDDDDSSSQVGQKRKSNSSQDEPSPKRRRKEERAQARAKRKEKQEAREARELHEKIINKHYSVGTWYGQAASGIVYALATVLERIDNEILWLAIISLTFQFTTARISRATYEGYQQLYSDEVARLNATFPEDAIPGDFEGIRTGQELRFTLLRHWTLYDAMLHSSYVANKLAIWKERGRRKLSGLFAKMGYSKSHTQQNYQWMSKKGRDELTDKLDLYAPEYGLVELSYPSFVRHYGHQRLPMGAADMVEGICALLDVGGRVKILAEVAGTQNGGEWFGGGRTWEVGTRWRDDDKENKPPQQPAEPNSNGNKEDANDDAKVPVPWWIKNFWAAYDALNNVKAVHEALFLSMSIHRAIIREGCSIIDKQQIKSMNGHRVVIITQGPDLDLLAQPATLSKLALWLVDSHRDRVPGTTMGRSKRKCLPFVVACLDRKAGSYLVVGVTAALEDGDVRKNLFGLAFLDAKEICNARSRHGTFDTSVIEINEADLTMFLQALCNRPNA
ncbi:cell division control protein 45 [Sistotremastrum suecicum HHB10207 ss-3]|uniref:Cell division control protein 45 n=1 Tax=Sistotremastrum suecicum HHB10207 ss-3 TaxID=1314776 RepID=A0A166GU80_9AGAM|nr:cell division control protein 45 [Sistotremastrum suecicum HHB10207 ss-3]